MKQVTVEEPEIVSYSMIERLKTEISSLRSIKEGIEKEIQDKRLVWNQKVDEQMEQIRQDKVKVAEEKTALDQAKAEFEKVMVRVKKEQDAFANERSTSANVRNEYAEKEARVAHFMRVIREEAGKL